jgi:hypothetical protein
MPFGQSIPVAGLLIGGPGKFTRLADTVTRSAQVLSTSANPVSFGSAVLLIPNSGAPGDTMQQISDFIANILANGGSFQASQFAGIACAEVTTTAGFPYNPENSEIGSFLQGKFGDLLERSSISVFILAGTPASQGQVYLRTALNTAVPNGVVGGLEAQKDATVSTTGTWSNGGTSVTVASGTGIAAGQTVTGAGIAPGTLVKAVSGTTVTLSQAATAAGSGAALAFDSSLALSGVRFRTGNLDSNNVAEITLLNREAA